MATTLCANDDDGVEIFWPWPLRRIRERLASGDALWNLCQSRTTTRAIDTRELTLEGLLRDVIGEELSGAPVTVRRRIGSTLQLQSAPFPANSQPDVVVEYGGAYHVCEVKSGRADYGRWDCVFESRPFQEYLASLGHTGEDPWEVEQDLIKLRQFSTLSPTIGSCLFLMVDAYAGKGRSWAKVFSNVDVFRSTMRTELVQGWAEELLGRTVVSSVRSDAIEAKLIACLVRRPHEQPRRS